MRAEGRVAYRMYFVALAIVRTYAASADIVLSDRSTTEYVIVADPRNSADMAAAHEVQRYLQRVTAASFPVVTIQHPLPSQAILIGDTARRFLPTSLAPEEVLITTVGERVIIAGGQRAAKSAAYRFLQELGCRWWTPTAEFIPSIPTLRFASRQIRESPAFDVRDMSHPSAIDPEWASRNLLSGDAQFVGFVHTFHEFVPPRAHFDGHPEWFPLIGGKRTGTSSVQLCLSNAPLRRFVAARVAERLRDAPGARFASVSQNDNHGFCECDDCRALYARYGGMSGAVLEFVNDVAAAVERDFPAVTIQTLAYADTRRPPRGIQARRNIAVAVACIECDASVPLTDRRNASFATDFAGWQHVTRHLHAWEYTGNYDEYLLPHPNWMVTAANARFFKAAGVESVFVYAIPPQAVAEMQELRAWMTARLLWDPQQDAGALMEEFLRGYYGAASARPIRAYIDLMARAVHGKRLQPYTSSVDAQFLSFSTMAEAERLWREAERLAPDQELRQRVERGHASVLYAWLANWVSLRREAERLRTRWPLAASRRVVASNWLVAMRGHEESALEEFSAHLTVREFARRVSVEPASEEKSSVPRAPRRIVWVAGVPQAGFAAAVILALSGLAAGRRDRHAKLAFIITMTVALSGLGFLFAYEGALRARYAAFVLAWGAISLACSGIYLIRAARRVSRTWEAFAMSVTLVAMVLVGSSALPYVKARFTRASSLRGVRLPRANLSRVILHGRDLRGADLYGANAQGAILNFASLDCADLRNTDLRGGMLIYTSMHNADLRGADLRDVILRDPTHTMFRGARYDASTRFPIGMRPEPWDMLSN